MRRICDRRDVVRAHAMRRRIEPGRVGECRIRHAELLRARRRSTRIGFLAAEQAFGQHDARVIARNDDRALEQVLTPRPWS